ncbi:chorismate mutase [Streptomyces sp. AM 2-1-1]|uniref:chorismate mutase n=1 Tax=Streptomyces sp. AM 2-1-1 TaxID=3028709 RepID=UPI0023B8CB94|nr:chorismate mutase [Streptomyces sp. AM 2-1-1]WEH42572.1 chorismate mutase [Streptomyces sp. AM 2-1-1]
MAVRAVGGAVQPARDGTAETDGGVGALPVAGERDDPGHEDPGGVRFATAPDLRDGFPVTAAPRRLGIVDVPLIRAREPDGGRTPSRVVRNLAPVETGLPPARIQHVRPDSIAALRKDIAQ